MTRTPHLSRALGVTHAGAIVIGTIIGSGIFLVPSEMMQAVGSARLVYLAWIVGGALSLAGAMTYAELGAMKPQAGGEYVYIRDAYGPLPVPAIFIAAASVLLYYTFTENLRNSVWGLAVIAAGLPVYLYFSCDQRRVTSL